MRSDNIIINGIKSGDNVMSNGKYNLAGYFSHGPLTVVRVEPVNLPYAGDAFVYCEYGASYIGFYINGIRKV